MNVYLTGDTHGRFERIACFCRDNHTTRGDCVIVHVPHRAQPSYLVDNISLSSSASPARLSVGICKHLLEHKKER